MPALLRRRRRPTPEPSRASIHDPIRLGIDENAAPVEITLIYRNILLAGEPDAGTSSGLNAITAHSARATDCADAIAAVEELRAEVDRHHDELGMRCTWLTDAAIRAIVEGVTL